MVILVGSTKSTEVERTGSTITEVSNNTEVTVSTTSEGTTVVTIGTCGVGTKDVSFATDELEYSSLVTKRVSVTSPLVISAVSLTNNVVNKVGIRDAAAVGYVVNPGVWIVVGC